MKSLSKLFEAVHVGREFVPQLKEHRGKLVLAGLLALMAASLEILKPWPLKFIVDYGLAPEAQTDLSTERVFLYCGLAALSISVLRAFLEYVKTLKITEAGHGVTRSVRLRIYSHLAELSPRFHRQNKAGDLLVRLMGDVPMLRTMLVDSSMMLVTRSLLVVGTAVVMFKVDPVLAGVIVCLLPVLALAVALMSRAVTIAVRKQRRKEGAMADFLHEAIESAAVIQALGQSRETVRRFARSNRRSARAGMKAARAAARLSGTVESSLGFGFALTLVLGAWRVDGGHLSLGDFLVFLSYVRSVSKPIRSSAKHSIKVAKGTACGERILKVLNEDQGVRETAGTESPPEQPSVLAFEEVHYSYEDQAALNGASLRVQKGQLTALFGASGAGKSTLAGLALRLMDPDEGCVKLDGLDLKRFDLDKLRSRYALSTQGTILFGESVRENLLLGRLDATDEELMMALESVGALDVVTDRQEGLDSILGSAGSGFSGGERKRLCLARALLRRAPVLIVDEPFSGLDRASADHVANTLRAYSRDHVVLAVTHEIDRLREFDQVHFLSEGRVQVSGEHSCLLKNHRGYAALCSGDSGGSR